MIGRIIHLSANDDAASVPDLLEWANANRVALNLPKQSALRHEVDFALIKHAAVQMGREVAIVSGNRKHRALANEVGLPAFRSIQQAATRDWLGNDEVEAIKRNAPPRRFQPNSLKRFYPRRNWLGMGASVLAFLLVLGAFVGAAVFILPSASVTLTAARQDLSTIIPVTLDPNARRPDAPNRIVPAKRIDVVVEDSLSVPATGKRDIPKYKARGTVTFFNILQQPYTVPRGAVVRSSASGNVVRFQTLSEVEAPAGGQVNVGIEALDDGIEGNVPAGTINVVEGVPSIAVRAINTQSTSGGGGDTVNAVTTADLQSARAALRRKLLEYAAEKMKTDPEVSNNGLYVVPDTLFIADVQDESADRFAGEQADIVTENMRLQVAGLAVSAADMNAIARAELSKRVPRGFDLLDVRTTPGDAAEEGTGSRTESFITAHGTAGTRIAASDIRRLARGKPIEEARQALTSAYSLKRPPTIDVQPEWLMKYLKRLPFIPMRIDVDIEAE